MTTQTIERPNPQMRVRTAASDPRSTVDLARRVLNIRYLTEFPTCNLACSYCIAGHGTIVEKRPDRWDEDRYETIIANLAALDHDINVRIGVGGEFFVSKVLMDGARRLSNAPNLVSLNLITNLTLSMRQYERIFRGYRTDKLAIVASFHPEQIQDHDDWFAKAGAFAEVFDFAVVVVAFPEFLDQIATYKARLNALGVSVFIQPFIGPLNGKKYPAGYSDEERAFVKGLMYSRHDYEYLLQVKKPGMCHAGSTAVFVNAMGEVFRCGVGKHKASLGDLSVSPQIELSSGPAPCPFRACQCDTENVNTVDFENHYERTDKNQHKYSYRFADLAAIDPRYDEWSINY